MIIVLKPSCTEIQAQEFCNLLKNNYDVKVNTWNGVHSTVLGLIGDTTQIDIEYIDAQDFVESVKRVQEPYKNANRKFHAEDTVIKVGNTTIGGGSITLSSLPDARIFVSFFVLQILMQRSRSRVCSPTT